MEKPLEMLLALVQVLGLLALIVYVWKTWEMAAATRDAAQASANAVQEMRAARDQQSAPYVVVYFDIPFGDQWIELVVRNVGKTPATDVRLAFDPDLSNSNGTEIGQLSLLRDGIPSLPPEHEIRTFFDGGIHYFAEGRDLPLSYRVRIRYGGGISGEVREAEQIADLSAYRGILFTQKKGMNDLVGQVSQLVQSTRNIEHAIRGLAEASDWATSLAGAHAQGASTVSDPKSWQLAAVAVLEELRLIWVAHGEDDGLVLPSFGLHRHLCVLALRLFHVTASAPGGVAPHVREQLAGIATDLLRLGSRGTPLRRFRETATGILPQVATALVDVRRCL